MEHLESDLKLFQVRRAEVEDSRGFSDLINSQGGQTIFRATFGQFTFANLVEYSYLSLSCTYGEEDFVGFAAFNDLNATSGEFDKHISALKTIIACNVKFYK